MIFFVFKLGSDRYAIEAAQVVEVLPLVKVKQVPQAPAGVAGILNYHGAPVPLIDLAEMAFGKPSERRMSTRILLVNYGGENGALCRIGLIVEQATEIIRRTEGDFVDSGVAAGAPYLGPVTTDASGMIQRIEIQKLLSESVRKLLLEELTENCLPSIG